ncbi:MAG TPA: Hsp70 family protein, partial [Minicystis sp.]|nr:Hsp70 family protein [Minicystis sp.]
MTDARARFVVGIDLGTTNTVVALAPADGSAAPRVLDLAQLVTTGEIEARPLLPSALHAALPGEALADPWGDAPWCVGELARRRGVDVPGRLVASHKSWLSYARVDRTAPILPWGADEDATDLPRLSPVGAATRVLSHVRAAFDAALPDAPLAAQHVVLTVPASFDDVARELTLDAATRAGLTVRLLEEPQAAFYDYLGRAAPADMQSLADGAGGEALVLVCDVGGGTTDLSLFKVRRSAGARPFEVERAAVGHHLLLGGDNMDLALAHGVEARLGQKLDHARFSALVGACRGAKERLLGDAPPASVPIAIASRGAALVGGTLRAELGKDEVERVVLDGFWPAAARDALPSRSRAALVSVGLPYER